MSLRHVKRALHVSGGALAGALACAVIAAGGLGESVFPSPELGPMMLLFSVTIILVTSVTRRLRFECPSARAQRVSFWLAAAPALVDIEMAFAMVGAAYAVIIVTGGLDSPMYPMLYGVIAFAVTFQSRPGAWLAVGAAALLELSLVLRQPVTMDTVVPALLHLLFLGGAATAHALFLRGLISRQRRQRQRRLERELEAQRDSARDYRLISAALGAESRAPRSRNDEEHMLAAGGVQAISASVFFTLGLLKRSLSAETCILLWMNERGDGLKLKELCSDSDHLLEVAQVPLAGVLGAVVRDQSPLMVGCTKPGQVPYYQRHWTGAFAAVPIMDGPHLRGLLCANRDAPFDDRELGLLTGGTEQIMRCVQSERVFLAVERAKYEHERFYHASALLCKALTLDEVIETAFDAASQIVNFEIAAITIYDAERKRHQVQSVRVLPGAEGMVTERELAGLEFRDNAGLAAMVVKNKHYLPAGGELRGITVPVYTRKVRLKNTESLLVLPLLCGDEAVGTFMLASRRKGHFTKDVRDMLGVIANQVAVSLQNGLMYGKMETMATTDGLTGLTNHRSFQERFEQILDRAERHGQPASFMLCDVDHFKHVNDTYGHPVGDEVLRQVARVLKSAVRKIDIPARYGGEEFAVVLEATGLAGACQLAERIRKDVAALVIDSDKGKFQVTMSIGVASFPHDGRDRATLIEHADQALYHAKESGRNRCISYQRYLDERSVRKAS
jgi:diguanylate cyclase (GGDEF)-like protein